jgi:hypothetical protein
MMGGAVKRYTERAAIVYAKIMRRVMLGQGVMWSVVLFSDFDQFFPSYLGYASSVVGVLAIAFMLHSGFLLFQTSKFLGKVNMVSPRQAHNAGLSAYGGIAAIGVLMGVGYVLPADVIAYLEALPLTDLVLVVSRYIMAVLCILLGTLNFPVPAAWR